MGALKIGLFGVAGLALTLGGCQTPHGGPVVRTAAACQDQAVQIYFEPGSADVTPEGRAVLSAAAAAAKPCVVNKVSVMGLADAAGDPLANLELSKRRAQSVTTALAATGLPAAEFDLTAAGQAGAVNARGDARLLRRRADVILHLAPR
jgi:outer membrane protein OmpA-like peptidoglycan-associated protein